MKTFIALLRGINVSGQKKIKMAELREQLGELGYQSLKTYIQSGNIVFKASLEDERMLEKQIKEKIFEHYQFDVQVMVLSLEDWEIAYKEIPFDAQKIDNHKILAVSFLSDIPNKEYLDEIADFKWKEDEFIIIGKRIYVYTPGGYGKTKLDNNFFERKLKVRATTRNWRTTLKLLEMARGLE
ncbi:MAG: DUF1697 domain-containing protein [Bacteroidia bacterium]|nr:DUF1697 domain-containing protein [Bacteroidia bacterium]